jgi:ABC-type amino acid transport substrate-binding protein
VRRDDTELLLQVNAVLAEWKGDGTLNRILGKWLPSWELSRP